MTREQLDAIRARVEAGPTRGLSTQIEIDRDGTTRWVNIGPYLCFTHEDAAKVRDVVSFVHNAPTDLRALLAEVERLQKIIDAVGEVISQNGEDCDCDCTAYGSPHGPNCDPCLACRVDDALGEKR